MPACEEERAMTTDFNPLNLPRHIRMERSGRTREGMPLVALVCTVCSEEEETPDSPVALRALAGRFVRSHMDCTPVGIDEE
jgi:hypothetical protein